MGNAKRMVAAVTVALVLVLGAAAPASAVADGQTARLMGGDLWCC